MAQLEDVRLPAAAREALVDDPNFLRQLVEAALNRFLDAEIAEHVQAGPYERSEARTGYRNGFRARQFDTRVGTLALAVPMDRDGAFRTELFDRYQCSEKASVRRTAGGHVDGDGPRGREHPEGSERDGGLVRHHLQQEHRESLDGWPGHGPQGLA